jgi:hypothetical protein
MPDLGTVAELLVERVHMYRFLRRTSFTATAVNEWRARAAAWGARLRVWLGAVNGGDGAYIKHH